MSTQPPVPDARRSGFTTPATAAWAKAWITRVAKQADPPLESTWVETTLGPTHVLRSPDPGTGNDVVCFPGFGTNGGWWCVAGNLAPLTRVARVWIADVPGHPGLSTEWAPPFAPDGYDLWVEELVDGLDLETVTLMGVSLGGMLAVLGSIRLGRRAERLVALAPAGFVRPWLGPTRLLTLVRHHLKPTKRTTERFGRVCVLGPQKVEHGPLAELEESLHRSKKGFANRSRVPPLLSDAQLQACKARAIVIVGENDPIFSAHRTLRRARRLMGNLEAVESLTGHGHGLEVSHQAMELAARFIGVARLADA